MTRCYFLSLSSRWCLFVELEGRNTSWPVLGTKTWSLGTIEATTLGENILTILVVVVCFDEGNLVQESLPFMLVLKELNLTFQTVAKSPRHTATQPVDLTGIIDATNVLGTMAPKTHAFIPQNGQDLIGLPVPRTSTKDSTASKSSIKSFRVLSLGSRSESQGSSHGGNVKAFFGKIFKKE
ncbi:hypothetical protein BDR26DRAFT_1007054 [Obelidium mucronatum]|nr:hypothetical protein BDR26DRAFT_1007054 [Obelidium mucronatum]